MTQVALTSRKTRSIKPRRRPWWVWVLFAFGFLMLIVLMGAFWIWSNRVSLLEQLAIDTLAAEGVEAELSIDRLSKTHVELKEVILRYDGETFFSSKRIRADYNWRDALEGRMKRLEFIAPMAVLTLDESGQISDGWVPPGFGQNNGDGVGLPPEGVKIVDGELTLKTPFGAGEILGDVELTDLQNYTADLKLDPSTFSVGDLKLQGGGRTELAVKQGVMTAKGKAQMPSLSHPIADAKDLTLSWDGTLNLKQGARSWDGALSAGFDTLTTAQANFETGTVDWQGGIRQSDTGLLLDGDWAADVAALRLPDPARIKNLAETLSLTPALSATPVAQNFVPSLERNLQKIFTQSAVNGAGTLRRDSEALTISLSQSVIAKADNTQLTLSPNLSGATYRYDPVTDKVESRFDVAITQPAGLSASDVVFTAHSINGWQIDNVEGFAAKIKSQRSWVNSQVPARLSPFSASVNYKGTDVNNRTVNLTGGINYDGPLPGGIVQELVTSGRMQVDLRPNRITVGYTPSGAGQVKIAKLETVTEWTATDITTKLAPASQLYNRRGSSATITAAITDLTLDAQRSSDQARLHLTAVKADISGQLTDKKVGLTQDWQADFNTAIVTSDDLPGPNSLIELGDGKFTAQLVPNTDVQFTLFAPIAQIDSPLIVAQNIGLTVSGTPTDFTLVHEGGKVKLTNNDLPPMPIKGKVRLTNGQFEGQATAYLPQANNTPIGIEYAIKDSRGTAHVTIEEIRFTPRGFQPQTLIPALRGKIARVDGKASAEIDLVFAAGEPMQSSGTAKLIDMNVGTAPGPLTGMNTEIVLESVLPLKTRGRQVLTVKSFDPGLPLENGVIEYELVPEGVKVYSARWPLGDGFFSLDPLTWLYAAEENRVTMRIENVGLNEFLNKLGNGAVQATGELEGVFPIVISGVNVRVEGGQLRVPNGGVIKYAAKEAAAAAQGNEYAGKAMEALRNLKYDELFAEINGPLDGDILLGMKFQGKNDKVLNGQPFAFDIKVEGELFNIMRSFNSNAQIKAELARKGVEIPE